MKAGAEGSNAGTRSSGGRRGPSNQKPGKGSSFALRRSQPGQGNKPNKKKDFCSTDVNGFMDYLKQTGQPLPRGQLSAPEFSEELNTAFKKDKRREDRRLKRQSTKKNNMVKKITKQLIAFWPVTHLLLYFAVFALWDL